jgi:hypothetical protein
MRVIYAALLVGVFIFEPHMVSGAPKVQTASGGNKSGTSALEVVDANNVTVGQFTGGGCFVRKVDVYWVDICGLQTDGTAINEALPTRYYIEPNCSGTPFAESFSGALLSRFAFTAHGRYEFVGDPVNVISVVSFAFQTSTSDNAFTCVNTEQDQGGFAFPTFEVRAGPLQSIPLSTLGVPPFRLR